jgi:transcriptional regulator with XRE-family HTH domain
MARLALLVVLCYTLTVTAQTMKRKRRQLGLTQLALAERVGVHRVTIAKWENGTEPIPKWMALLLELLVKTEGMRT